MSQYPVLNPWSLFAAGAMVSLTSLMAASSCSGSPSNRVTRANISILPNFVSICDARGQAYARHVRRPTQGSEGAELVERTVQIRGIAIDPERAGRRELVPAVPTREQSHAQHSRAARGEQIPYRVAHHVTIANLDAELLLASQKQIRLGFRAQHIAAVDDHGLLWNPQRLERAIDLRVSPRRRDAMRDLLLAQPPQKLDRTG